jgi:hypothetical protein
VPRVEAEVRCPARVLAPHKTSPVRKDPRSDTVPRACLRTRWLRLSAGRCSQSPECRALRAPSRRRQRWVSQTSCRFGPERWRLRRCRAGCRWLPWSVRRWCQQVPQASWSPRATLAPQANHRRQLYCILQRRGQRRGQGRFLRAHSEIPWPSLGIGAPVDA